MSSVESSKTMALVGSILLIIGSVAFYGAFILGIIGIILLLMGIKGFSDFYQDPEMYQNALRGVINYIIASIFIGIALVGLVIMFTVILFFIGLAMLIIGLILGFIFYIQAARRLRETFNDLAKKTNEHSFETAGTLLWWGAILTIIIVGVVLIFVAWIFAAIGFFSMRTPGQPGQPQPYGPPPPPPPPPQTASTGQRYCPNCGAPVDATATFCPNCGKQLPPA